MIRHHLVVAFRYRLVGYPETGRLSFPVDEQHIMSLASQCVWPEFAGDIPLVGKTARIHQQVTSVSGNRQVQFIVMLMPAAPGTDVKKRPLGIGVKSAPGDQLTCPGENHGR